MKAELLKNNMESFNLNCEINIDTLATFLDVFFPDRDNIDDIDLLYDEMKENGFTYSDIIIKQRLVKQILLH